MNNRPECIPCCLRRVLAVAGRTTADDWLHRKVLAEVMAELARVDDKATPAEVVHGISRKTARTLGMADPFAEEKRRWVEETTGNAEWIRSVVDAAPDPFVAALRLSIAANILDCELRGDLVRQFSLRSLIDGLETVPFAMDNVEEFREATATAGRILFIHDAAGELFFDRLLIERMGKPRESVLSVVRAVPILADATHDDAVSVGLDQVATIIDPGIDCLGIPINACSEEFREHYRSADLIIAKGQAAFETLEGKDSQIDKTPKQIFFLLRVKCALVARHLGVSPGDCVLEVG